MNDTTLIRQQVDRLRQGDATAADALFNRFDARLRRLSQKMLSSFPSVNRWWEADDILQNASLRLWRALESVRPDSTRDFLNLAAVQMRRELIDMARSLNGPLGLARRHDSVADMDMLPPGGDANADLQRWTDLHEEAANLPPAEREVFELIFYHGCPQAEVAEICQVDIRTIRRRWAAAILQLRNVMAELPSENS